MAAASPPDEANVEVSLFVTEGEFQALERLAEELRTPMQRVLREAVTSSLVIHGLLSEGCAIMYRTMEGVMGEIVF